VGNCGQAMNSFNSRQHIRVCPVFARSAAVLLLLFVALPEVVNAFQTDDHDARVEGVVLDSLHAPLVNAHVWYSSRHYVSGKEITGIDGGFAFDIKTTEPVRLIVEVKGFSRVELLLNLARGATRRLEVVLNPAPIKSEVTVTASRVPIETNETAASVRVISTADLETTAAPTVDDALRQIPGFQLFRRSGSRIANPTAQGVSLRGVGASGASRALVLVDGIPINDPFGGWVYWGRVPRESLDRVEVVRGAASDLYGSAALGGVVGMITKATAGPLLALETSYGNEQTLDGSFFTGSAYRKLNFTLAGELQNTDGYIVVPEQQRGPIDTRVDSRHSAVNLRIAYDKSPALQLFLRGAYFRETRNNGTPLQTNATLIREVNGGANAEVPFVGSIALRLYLSRQLLDQNFSAVGANHATETLTRLQRVPAQVAGFSVQSSRGLGDKQTVIYGMDAREVQGASDEIAYVQGRATSFLGAGGRERDWGVFLKDIVNITPQFTITAGARFDHWRNYQAHSDVRPVNGATPVVVNSFADRNERAISPQLSVLYKPNDRLGFFASSYGAFRAPTLNELYRSFRVGNVLTLANEQLRAERLWGGEGGMSVRSLDPHFSLRGSVFWTQISRSIANVTVATTPDLITRVRRNLGSTRARGLELESNFNLRKNWSVSAGYLLADSTVLRFPANAVLEGLRIPQVARHNFTFQTQYAKPSLLSVALQGRASSSQFDDDLNLFRLPAYFTLDAFASRRLTAACDVFVAAENVFDRQYLTGRTPVATLGPPRLLRVGFRLHLPKK
jgi:outer membrane receptor protein involved in Fe transport